MGVELTCDAEPLTASDRQFLERTAVNGISKYKVGLRGGISMIKGVRGVINDGRLEVELADETEYTPRQIGSALMATIRHIFPLIDKLAVKIRFDRDLLESEAGRIREELVERRRMIKGATDESIDVFATCVGCSPFAPDHACILTPERPSQCVGADFARFTALARYSHDDTYYDYHHRTPHAGLNTVGVIEKGTCLDAKAGEWSGVNEAVTRLTGGRTRRIQLHSLDEVPHTACGCFKIVMFQTEEPSSGIGIMDKKYEGTTPDGRSWRDLYYALTGKQVPGMAAASPAYFKSPKFLQAHNGWDGVVWVSQGVADYMGERLPEGIAIG
jgi:acetyl-CoA decarbonylase/synthase complex subunit beta